MKFILSGIRKLILRLEEVTPHYYDALAMQMLGGL
uniref:Uncharacterized protein n=1 Tax=Planktothrix pseudagardhii TaxID=132604 RepID=A0A9W4CZP0_9CYAN|nr:hypothetical protein NO713_05735 [Planktothrix pseudagardhii]